MLFCCVIFFLFAISGSTNSILCEVSNRRDMTRLRSDSQKLYNTMDTVWHGTHTQIFLEIENELAIGKCENHMKWKEKDRRGGGIKKNFHQQLILMSFDFLLFTTHISSTESFYFDYFIGMESMWLCIWLKSIFSGG